MRCLNRNKQALYYALATASTASSEAKKVVVDGVEVYVEDGDYIQTYSKPEPFKMNIVFTGDSTTDAEFGVDRTAYDAILMDDLNSIPITETSLIWFESEPPTTTSDGKTADFSVVAVKNSLNYFKAILKKRVRQ